MTIQLTNQEIADAVQLFLARRNLKCESVTICGALLANRVVAINPAKSAKLAKKK